MLVTQTESNPHLGRMLIGKLQSGSISIGDKLQAVNQEGEPSEVAKIIKMIKRYGLSFIEIDKAFAGDIFSLAGFSKITVGHVINSLGKYGVIKV